MEFKIKTEPVCIVLVAVPAYAAIATITIRAGLDARDVWYPVSLIAVILYISIRYIAK
jgi:hypothetical protein